MKTNQREVELFETGVNDKQSVKFGSFTVFTNLSTLPLCSFNAWIVTVSKLAVEVCEFARKDIDGMLLIRLLVTRAKQSHT